MEKVKSSLQKFVSKIDKSITVKIIQKALATLMALTIVGSIFSLLTGISVESYQNFLTETGLLNVFNLGYNVTIGHIGLYTAFAVGYQYACHYKQRKNAVSVGLLSIAAFLMASAPDNMYGYVGTTGMFGGIVIGIFVGYVFKQLVNHNITIKMPEEVPPMVAQSFTALIPAVVVIAIFTVVNYAMTALSLVSLQDVIYTFLRVPLTKLGGNFIGELIFMLYVPFLWFFGIHGGMVVMPIMNLVFADIQFANLSAYQSGQSLPYLFTGISIGAGYVCLNIAILLVSHRKEIRELGKLGFVPALFTINEPMLFGLPMILNPIMFVPFVLQTMIPHLLTRLLQIIGLISYGNCASTPWCLPQCVIAFLRFGWAGAIASIVFTIMGVLIWIPFIKAYEKRLDNQDKLDTETTK